jgi:GNAT superfamily N-acetyltransferase
MAQNYLFVPMTEAEAQHQLGPLKLVMDPNLLQIAEHQGQPVGVTMCVPDVVPMLQAMRSRIMPLGWWTFLTQRRRLKGASIIIILTRPEHQAAGLTRVLFYRLFQALKAGGYTCVGGTWIGDDNIPSLKSAEAIGMKPYHRLKMFDKNLL